MKKALFITAFAMTISMAFTSCRKCEICTRDSSPEVRICEKDYNSNTEYAFTLDALEITGYDCR